MIESQHVEFKCLWQDNYLKTFCAFANSQGGSLFLGVDDNGEVLGVEQLVWSGYPVSRSSYRKIQPRA